MPRVTFLKTGLTVECAEGASFLDVCQEHDAPHDFGCTVGSCGTCRLEVVEGAEGLPPIGDEERETVEMCTDVPGARLGCQLRITADVAVRPVD